MPGYGGLAQMGYLLDMAMRAGNFFGWLSPSVPSAASSDNNSELIRVSHARSKQIVEDLLKQEKMLFAQSRVATDDDSVAEAP
jgi:hypothetical protein